MQGVWRTGELRCTAGWFNGQMDRQTSSLVAVQNQTWRSCSFQSFFSLNSSGTESFPAIQQKWSSGCLVFSCQRRAVVVLRRLLHLLFAPISSSALLFLIYPPLWDLLVCGRIWRRSCRVSPCTVTWILSKDKNKKRSARRAGYALISVFPKTPPC